MGGWLVVGLLARDLVADLTDGWLVGWRLAADLTDGWLVGAAVSSGFGDMPLIIRYIRYIRYKIRC